MKLSNRLLGESVNYLENFLKKKRKRPLSKTKIEAIEKLIEQRRKENADFAERLLASPLCKLAITQISREGKAHKINPASVMITMLDIVDTAHKTKKKDILDEYCSRQ